MPLNVKKETLAVITKEAIQEKADLYFEYMSTKVEAGQEIYVSNVVAKEDLDLLFAGKNYYGVKVLLVKEAGQPEQQGIGMFLVPVIADSVWGEGTQDVNYINQLGDDDRVIYEFCPSKYCKMTDVKLPL